MMINIIATKKAFMALTCISLLAMHASAGTVTCLSNPNLTTLRALIDCFNEYTVPGNKYTQTTYNAAQPSAQERTAWVNTVTNLLYVDGNCTSLTVPSDISAHYGIGLCVSGGLESYCVFAEMTTTGSYYTRGWGLMVVPATAAGGIRRLHRLHFSAPHPQADLITAQQAASIFAGTRGRSLLIAGRHRTAYSEGEDAASDCNGQYSKTDATHDNTQPFFDAAVAIRDWQKSNGGGPNASCAYIQMHGKGASSCASDNIFLSAGLGSSPSSITCYTNPNLPVHRVRDKLRSVFPTWTISMPTDSNCSLAATENVLGRLLNGVSLANVCTTSGTSSTATGQFIHAEQDIEARQQTYESEWTAAICAAYKRGDVGNGSRT